MAKMDGRVFECMLRVTFSTFRKFLMFNSVFMHFTFTYFFRSLISCVTLCLSLLPNLRKENNDLKSKVSTLTADCGFMKINQGNSERIPSSIPQTETNTNFTEIKSSLFRD